MRDTLKVISLFTVILAFLGSMVYTSALTVTHLISTVKPEVIIVEEAQKPSYEYLKSITVNIYGTAESSGGLSFFLSSGKEISFGGTGVIVKVTDKETYILTNNHMTGQGYNNAKIYVKEENQNLVPITILAQSETYDMALVKVNKVFETKKAVKGFNKAKIADSVYMVGNYLGIPYIYSEGVMSGYEEDQKDGVIFQLPSNHGNSGSGIINKDGDLVALLYAGHAFGFFQEDTTKAIAVDGQNVIAFLKENKIL